MMTKQPPDCEEKKGGKGRSRALLTRTVGGKKRDAGHGKEERRDCGGHSQLSRSREGQGDQVDAEIHSPQKIRKRKKHGSEGAPSSTFKRDITRLEGQRMNPPLTRSKKKDLLKNAIKAKRDHRRHCGREPGGGNPVRKGKRLTHVSREKQNSKKKQRAKRHRKQRANERERRLKTLMKQRC